MGRFVPHASAPLAHGSGGAFVHDGRGFCRYALLCSFFAADVPCAPCGLGVRFRGPQSRPLYRRPKKLTLLGPSYVSRQKRFAFRLRRGLRLRRARLSPLCPALLFFCRVRSLRALRAWSPLQGASVAALIPTAQKLTLLGPSYVSRQKRFAFRLRRGLRLRRARGAYGGRSRGPYTRRSKESFSTTAGIIPANQKSR